MLAHWVLLGAGGVTICPKMVTPSYMHRGKHTSPVWLGIKPLYQAPACLATCWDSKSRLAEESRTPENEHSSTEQNELS